MTSRTGMRVHSNEDGVCGNNAVQFQSCDGSSYCTALRESSCIVIVSRQLRDLWTLRSHLQRISTAMCMDPTLWATVWSGDYVGNTLKAEPMCTTKTVVADRPWWRQNWWKVCGKQFCWTGASKFRNSLVSSPRGLAHFCTKSSPGVLVFAQCVQDGCQSSWQMNTKPYVWPQHWHSFSDTQR